MSTCQDISSAGLGAGIKEGTRSGLWYRYLDAVRVLRPRLVIVENVSALLVRGIDIVIGGLASLGYVGSWCRLRASDVGAPHQRTRIFLLAWPATDADGLGREGAIPEPLGYDGRSDPRPYGRSVVPLLPTPAAANPNDGEDLDNWLSRRERVKASSDAGNGFGMPLAIAVRLLPTPTTAPMTGNGHARHLGGELKNLPTPTASLGGSRGTPNRETARRRIEDEGRRGLDDAVALLPSPTSGSTPTDAAWAPRTDFGPYEPAVRRWEALTRPAPAPTDEKGRLDPPFPEWMMGFEPGWITDHLGRSAALRAIGNSVVRQQAAAAIRILVARIPALAAS